MQKAHDVPRVEVPPMFEGEPIPLALHPITLAFPVDAFPPKYADMIEALAEATQTDPAMAAVSCLSVLAATAGGRARVEVRRGWREPLCLYCATIARPGERKSAVQTAMTRPLLDVERTLAEEGREARTQAITLQQIAVKDAERARNAASGAAPDNKGKAQAEAISAAGLAESLSLEVPHIPRIIADDVTPEALGSLLAEQGGRLAIISAEGGVFDIIAGRYNGNIPAMDVYLKGHAGDPLKVDRKGRDPEYIESPALTIGVMFQPAVLTALGRHEQFRGRGLLARFLYSEPVSRVGHRKAGAEPVPEDVLKAYDETVAELVEGLAGWGSDPAIVQFTPEAAHGVVRIEADTEPSLAGNGELASFADWGAKYVGAVVRIAGLLHLAEHGSAGVRRPIEQATLVAAVRIGRYFKAHAVRAFTTMQMDTGTADALYLLQQVAAIDGAQVSSRDLYRQSRGRFKTVDAMAPALNRLIDHGFLALLREPASKGPGRKPAPALAIHPHAKRYGHIGRNGQN